MAFSTKGIAAAAIATCAVVTAITFIPPEGVNTSYILSGDGTRFQSKENFAKKYDLQKQAQSEEDRNGNGSGGSNVYKEIPIPDDMTKENLLAYVEQLAINPDRKELLRNAVESIGVGSYSLGGHNNWSQPSFAGSTIDCSGFVAWCYNKIGFNAFGGCTTDSINQHYVETSNPLPGDVGNVTVGERRANGANSNYGHAGIWLGKNSAGVNIYIDAGGGAVTTCKPHAHIDWGRILVHPDMKTKDDAYYASSGGGSGGGLHTADGSFKLNDPKDARMPDTEFLRFNATDNKRNILIVIDPGHGPSNTSGISDWSTGEYYSVRGTPYNGQTEEDFTFHVGEYLKDMLVDAGFDVITTRKDINAIVPNKLRAYMAEEVQADMMVCIHWNGGGGAARGPVRMTSPSGSNSSAAVDGIWELYKQKQNARLGTNRNDVQTMQLCVFGACTRPILYLETGFADNAQDVALLAGDENNKATAQVIADSIIEWYDNH